MSYCSVEDVKILSGIKPKNLGLKENETEFNRIINDWIAEAEGYINSYCKRKWAGTQDDPIPLVVKSVCTRLVANIIAFHLSRKDNPIRKVNDYTTKIYGSEVFTDDLRQDLKPFRKSSRVSVFKI